MRHIGSIQDGEVATRFGDYLTAAGVGNEVEQGSSGFSIWVHDDDHVERATRELGEFLSDPSAPRYEEASRAAERVREEDERRRQKLRRNFIDVRTSWSG